jgi:hypothetical protein
MADEFYNALRGFIVIEESGLPKYIEFLTKEKIDTILLSGLLSGLQSLAEVISEEQIKSIETTNSTFIFEIRRKYFYVLWIDKTIKNLELYEPLITKIISRFEGATKDDIENQLILSNLDETTNFERIGQRLMKIRRGEPRERVAYYRLQTDGTKKEAIDKIATVFAGIDGVLIISQEGKVLHTEFSRGEPIFEVHTLTNFLVGLKKSIKNLDPGILKEVTTQNYRFIIVDSADDFFYVFEVIKGLANEQQLYKNMKKIIRRFEGIRRKDVTNITLLNDLEAMPEHEILGQLSLEVQGLQKISQKRGELLQRERDITSFGDEIDKWLKEEEQLDNLLETFDPVFLAGIITNQKRFFVTKKTRDINDWIRSTRRLQFHSLMRVINKYPKKQIIHMTQNSKEFCLLKINDNALLFIVMDQLSVAAERFMLRLPRILKKISNNI